MQNNVMQKLISLVGEPRCELNYNNSFELLCAVILSAQCTDKRVNTVTKVLFDKYKDAQSLSKAHLNDVELIVKTCGLYHNKARNLIEMSKKLVADFNGEVPSTMPELLKLDGVGRKTANVMLATYFLTPAIAVDTHVFRTAKRLNLSKSNSVLGVENDLMKKFNKDCWRDLHFLLVLFGRYICHSKNPECEKCSFADTCKYRRK